MKNSIKLWQLCIGLGVSVIFSGCSTYTTNSDITFESTQLGDTTPIIHVGEIQQGADQLTYLGWVEAEVHKPSPMHRDPTKAQANIVLAHLAQEMGAEAVIHVTYKRSIGQTGLPKLMAKGQAVRFSEAYAGSMIEPQIPDIDAIVSPEDGIAPVPEEGPVVSDLLSPELQSAILSTGAISAEALDQATQEEVIQPIDDSVGLTPVATTVEPDFSIFEPVDLLAEDIEKVRFMLSNAEYIRDTAFNAGNKELYNAALRMHQLLTNYLNRLLERQGK